MSTDEDRLAALMNALTSSPAFVRGNEPFPGRVNFHDAADIAEHVMRELEAGTAVRTQAAEKLHLPIACEKGCNACCNELVLTYLPEALAVARWLKQPEQAEVRERFLDAFDEWIHAVGDVSELVTLAADDKQREAYEAAHVVQARKGVMCAFNHEGACSIYPVRPLVCRDAHAVEGTERCFDPALGPVQKLAYEPVDSFMKQAALLLRATHNAVSPTVKAPKNRMEALCDWVSQLI